VVDKFAGVKIWRFDKKENYENILAKKTKTPYVFFQE
jgi:hypothetical protein